MPYSSVRILIIGIGGIGSEVLRLLCQNNLNNISIVDHDKVELSNLNRQLSDVDIGALKVNSASHSLSIKFQDLNITCYPDKIENFPLEFFKAFHIVICCLDSIESRMWVQHTIKSIGESNDTLLIDCGSEEFQGHVSIGLNKNFDKLFLEKSHDKIPICTISNSLRSSYHMILHACLIEWPKTHAHDFDILNKEHLKVIRNTVNSRIEKDQVPVPLITLTDISRALGAFTITSSPTNSLVASLCVQRVLNLINGIDSNSFLFTNIQSGINLVNVT